MSTPALLVLADGRAFRGESCGAAGEAHGEVVFNTAMLGRPLTDLGFTEEREPEHIAIKEAVFPFVKFPGTDVVLGPEMKSTGEVMGEIAGLHVAGETVHGVVGELHHLLLALIGQDR